MPSTQISSRAAVHDSDYHLTLLLYNVHVQGGDPPPGFREAVEAMIFRQRHPAGMGDTELAQMRRRLVELEYEAEETVIAQLGQMIPGLITPFNQKLKVSSGWMWHRAVALPYSSELTEPTLPLPKPKPDTTFSYSAAAFSKSQLATMGLLGQGARGPSFASPHRTLLYPYAVIEFKSMGTNGSIREAKHQAAGAGAVALNGLLETMSRGPGLDSFDLSKLRVFSVIINQELAYINVQWIGQRADTGQHTFHFTELRVLPLRYGDNIRVLQRALEEHSPVGGGGSLANYRRCTRRVSGQSNQTEEEPELRGMRTCRPTRKSSIVRVMLKRGKGTARKFQRLERSVREFRNGQAGGRSKSAILTSIFIFMDNDWEEQEFVERWKIRDHSE